MRDKIIQRDAIIAENKKYLLAPSYQDDCIVATGFSSDVYEAYIYIEVSENTESAALELKKWIDMNSHAKFLSWKAGWQNKDIGNDTVTLRLNFRFL